jgi:hypothetical protein
MERNETPGLVPSNIEGSRRDLCCRGFFAVSKRSTRLTRSPFNTTIEIRSVAEMSRVDRRRRQRLQ